MTSRFIPDKHKRVRDRRDEKNVKHPNRNQPQPKIWTVTLFDPKPMDRVRYFIVEPKRQLDLYRVRDILTCRLGQRVTVYTNLFNMFDVSLEKPTCWGLIESIILELLETLD